MATKRHRHLTVSPDELKDGDHIYKCRFQFGDHDDTSRRYLYSHHGIYHAESGRVIDFGRIKHEQSPDEDSVIAKVGKNLVLGANKLIHHLFEVDIKSSHISTFFNKADRVCLYRYGMPVEECNEPCAPDCIVPEEDKNKAYAAKLAKWFYDHPKAFGKYNVATWNCEHFATFCHVTDLRTETLEKHYSSEGSFNRSFLRTNGGPPFSYQAKKLFGSNSKILKAVSKHDEESDERLAEPMYEFEDVDEDIDEDETDGVTNDESNGAVSGNTQNCTTGEINGNDKSLQVEDEPTNGISDSPTGRRGKRKHEADTCFGGGVQAKLKKGVPCD